MSIKVYNDTNATIDVAISRWGSTGNTDFCRIKAGSSDEWSRTNPMGFVMVITLYKGDKDEGSYWYVRSNTDVRVSELHSVTNADELKNPYKR